jgi:hypothetical protein
VALYSSGRVRTRKGRPDAVGPAGL